MRRNVAKTLFSVSHWIQGMAVSEDDPPEPPPAAPAADREERPNAAQPLDLLSCSDLSSNGLSAEVDAAGLHPTPGSKPTSRGLPPAATRPLPVPPAFSGYVAKVQLEVDAVLAAFPEDTPPAVLCHSIGYVLQAKYSWHVKLCCKAVSTQFPSTLPRTWLEGLMVVQPAPDVACVVDLQFRLKFLIRGEGDSAVQYLSHIAEHVPAVFVGSLGQLFKDVDMWATAMEQLFEGEGRAPPPWRSRQCLRQLYKFCLECDATASTRCLRHVGAQLQHRGRDPEPCGQDLCCHVTCPGAGQGPQYLTCLAAVLSDEGPSPPRVGAAPPTKDEEELEYSFNKVFPLEAEASAEGPLSGLSELLGGHQWKLPLIPF